MMQTMCIRRKTEGRERKGNQHKGKLKKVKGNHEEVWSTTHNIMLIFFCMTCEVIWVNRNSKTKTMSVKNKNTMPDVNLALAKKTAYPYQWVKQKLVLSEIMRYNEQQGERKREENKLMC